MKRRMLALIVVAFLLACSAGCAVESTLGSSVARYSGSTAPASPEPESPSASASGASTQAGSASASSSAQASASSASADSSKQKAKQIFDKLGIQEDYREDLAHGDKPAKYQKYIVLHDTEGGGTPEDVVNTWESAGRFIATHFVVGRDGSIVQCVKLDKIAHHAGFGDTGHNKQYGVEDESRDDRRGAEPIGDWASDYGMNSYSIGIEMVHVGGEEDYPEVQLQAVDALIAYIDAYYADTGKKSEIIDHKAWRSGNSDTSEEFTGFYEYYRGETRTHDGKAWNISALDGWKEKVAEAASRAQAEAEARAEAQANEGDLPEEDAGDAGEADGEYLGDDYVEDGEYYDEEQ